MLLSPFKSYLLPFPRFPTRKNNPSHLPFPTKTNNTCMYIARETLEKPSLCFLAPSPSSTTNRESSSKLPRSARQPTPGLLRLPDWHWRMTFFFASGLRRGAHVTSVPTRTLSSILSCRVSPCSRTCPLGGLTKFRRLPSLKREAFRSELEVSKHLSYILVGGV